MYWPIGAPRVYAASKHELNTAISTDGADVEPGKQDAVASTNGTATRGRDGEQERESDEEIDGKAQTEPDCDESDEQVLQNNGLLRRGSDSDPGGEIVGLKLSRNGHMFATITQSTLTIWQTKVCISPFRN
jgi:hypothetical protein